MYLFFYTDSIFENGIANQRDQSTKQNFTFFSRVHQCEFDQFFAFFCMTCQNIFRPVWRDDKNPRRIHWKDTILLKKRRHFFHIFHRSRTIESRLKKFNTNILLIQIYTSPKAFFCCEADRSESKDTFLFHTQWWWFHWPNVSATFTFKNTSGQVCI